MELFRVFGSIAIRDDEARRSLRNIDNEAENTSGRMGGVFQRAGSAMGKAVVAGAAVAATGLVALTGVIGKVGISYNAMMEQSEVAWKTLLGSQEAAQKMLKDISDFTKATPFETESVDMMAKYMHNAGLEGQDLFDALLKVSDVASAFAIPAAEAQELTRQMSQVRQAGVAYTEDLNVLQDRGVPIYKAIAEQLGVNVAEVKKMASEGKITSEIYVAAFDSIAKGVAGASEAQSKTFNGMISTLKDNLKMISGELAKGAFERLKVTLEGIMPIVERFLSSLQEGGLKQALAELFPPGLQEKISGFATGFTTAFETIKAFVMPAIQAVAAFVMSKVSEIKSFWDSNGAQIVKAVTNAFNMIKAVIDFVMPAILFVIKMVWESIKGVIDGALNIIMGLIKVFAGLFTGDFSKMWEGIKQLFKGAIEFVWNLVNLMLFGKIVTGIKTFATNGISLFKNFWSKTVEIFKELDTHVINIITKFLTNIFSKFRSLYDEGARIFGTLRTFGENAFSAMWTAIKSVVDNIFTGVTSKISSMATSVRFKFDEVLSSAKTIFNNIKSAIETPIETAKSTVQKAVEAIKGFFANMKVKIPMPHFNVSTSTKSIAGIDVPVPKIDVDWYAKGTNFAPGGLAVVGEHGPELVHLPRGSKVDTANETASKLGGGTQYGDVYVTISAKDVSEFNSVVDFFNRLPQAVRAR